MYASVDCKEGKTVSQSLLVEQVDDYEGLSHAEIWVHEISTKLTVVEVGVLQAAPIEYECSDKVELQLETKKDT
jgi:hypothetical protein